MVRAISLEMMMPVIAGAAIATTPTGATAVSRQDRRWQGELALERTFDVSPGGTLRVDLADGDVSIRPGGTGTVHIEVFIRSRDLEWGREVFDRMNFRASQSGGTVTLLADQPRIYRDEWRSNRGVGVTARITVPERFNLDVETSDGDVDIANVVGEMRLHSSDGDLTVGNVRGTGIELTTSDGDVVVDALTVAWARVRTSDGDVRLDAVNGAVEARTSDGDIRITLTGGEAAGTELSTADGDITIYAPETMRASLFLEGEDLIVSRGFAVRGRLSRRRIEGDLNGGGPRVTARTRGGEIALRVRNP